MRTPTSVPTTVAAAAGLSRRALLPLFAAALAPSALSGSGASGGAWLASPASAGEPAKALEARGSLGGYSWKTPPSWGEPQKQSFPDGRQIVISADPADTDFNVFFATTPIPADYGSLGSFGNLDYVGTTFLPQCPVRRYAPQPASEF